MSNSVNWLKSLIDR